MKDRTREALFNRLREFVPGRPVIDLFAGTGALGLEALSRGARSLTAIEGHPESAQTLRQNIHQLGLSSRASVVCTDVFLWTGSWGEPHSTSSLPMDLEPTCIFCCPPYDLYRTREEDLLDFVATICRHTAPESVLVIESETTWRSDRLPEPERWTRHDYRPASLHIRWPVITDRSEL